MSFQSRRLIVVAALLAITWLFQYGISSLGEKTFQEEISVSRPLAPTYLFSVDTEGWSRTANQSIAIGRYNLGMTGDFSLIPNHIGDWHSQDILSTSTDLLGFTSPQTLFRLYSNSNGRLVWLRLITTTDWQLFYHTPPICYVGNNWALENEKDLTHSLGSTSLPVKSFVAHQGSISHLVEFTFLWPSRYRDMSKGTTMVELVAPFSQNDSQDYEQAQQDIQEFVQLLFSDTSGETGVESPMQHRVNANFQDKVELLGYDLSADSLKPGDVLAVTLYWKVTMAMDHDYTMFLHLLDGRRGNGTFLAQNDTLPFNGIYQTSSWKQGEVLKETYELHIPENARRGQYELETGMYEAENGQRLNVLGLFGRRIGNSTKVGSVFVDGPLQ